MTNEMIIVVCVLVAFFSVLLVEGLKKLIQHIYKKKGRQFNMKKFEYPFASMPIVLTFVIIFLVLFYASDMELYDILKLAAIFATSTQTIYTFIVQLFRKGTVAMVGEIQKLSEKAKTKKALHADAKDLIDTMKEATEEASKEEPETFDSFLKDISKGK